MSVALNKENFVLHRIHSLTGIVPVGYYMVQHLALNTFSIAGRDQFNSIINFFEGIPKHILLVIEFCMIWLPLAFHAVYGLFIAQRAKTNYIGTKYGFTENRMFYLQRVSGIFIFLFLCMHVATTTGAKYLNNNAELVKYDAWHEKLTSHGYIWLVVYMVAILASSYHLGYGIWNFCVRWGITISDKAQQQVQKFSVAVFVALTLMGWAALAGFLIHGPNAEKQPVSASLKSSVVVSQR